MKSSAYQFICVVIHVVTSSHYVCLISASCSIPEPIANTTTTSPNQTLDTGFYITWKCSDGYIMDGQTNTAVWVCLEDGSWLGHTPICTAIGCLSPPKAAYSELDPPLAQAFLVNQTISFTCSSSEYTLIGSRLNRCLQDGTWENDPPVCQRDCGGTADYIKRYSDLTCYRRRSGNANTIVREWIDSSVVCNNNGELLATVKDAETQKFLVDFIRGQIDNSVWIGAMEGRDWMWRRSGENIERFFWQIPFPSANSKDCIELSYQDGSFSWSPRSNQTDNGLLCQYETRMNYEGWHEGEPSSFFEGCVEMRWNFQYQWNDQPCSDRIRTLCQIGIPACGDPGEPLHGNRLPDDRTTYSVGATLHFTCQEGYNISRESVLRCMNNGSWNHQRPSCEAVECEESPPNVTLSSNTILGSVYQDIAVYTCQGGYIPDNEPISFCQHTGTWSTPNFTCTALNPCYANSNPCVNGGTCTVNGSSFTCTCPSRYTGPTCEEEFRPCNSNPCMNGGTCIDVDASSFSCTCPSGYIGPTCIKEIRLTTPFTFTTQASPQSTGSQTESPKGNSLPSGVVAAGSSVVILFILVVIVLTTVLFRRRRAAKAVSPDDENEMENYAAVANCYEDSKPADSTPHAPYYLTLEPDSDQNGGFGDSDTPSVIKGSNGWNETDTEDGFVDNVLYGTSDEQTVSPSSLNHNSTDHKVAKHHAITTSHQSPGRPKPGHPKSGAPETDEDAYEGYEDEKVMVDNELYGAPSPITSRAHKHGAVADQENDAVYENPDGNVYETYEEDDSMVDNELYGAVTPPTSRADNMNDAVVGEGDGEMYQNTEFHSVPTNLIANEFYKSVDEI